MLPFLFAKSIKLIEKSSYHVDVSDIWSSCRAVDDKHIKDRMVTCDMLIENMKKYDLYHKYKVYVDYQYLRLHINTIVNILAWSSLNREVFVVADDISRKAIALLPNSMFDATIPTEQKELLLHPQIYLKKVKKERVINSIRGVIHGFRHTIVIFIKKTLGMNPNKSIFAK